MKVGLISSSGGHWEELMCLSKLDEKYEVFYVTEKGGQSQETTVSPIYEVNQINRHEKKFLNNFLKLVINAWGILKEEKPDVVITTGALMSYPFCLLTKIKGGKVIYIESFARVHNKSLTGRLVYPFADLFLVQWEEMKCIYPKAEFLGSIF